MYFANMSIAEVITYLKTNIDQTDITLNSGASSSLIAKFENTFNVRLPNDIKQFYEFSNGFESAEDDFRIVPIEEMLDESLSMNYTEINIAEYLIYCDIWNLEINTEDHNLYHITNVGSDNKKVVLTTSFAELIQRFLKGGVFEPGGLYRWLEEINDNDVSSQ
ncbi:MAG: SMI1/KNR4 family protein [Flavobacterium sp.]|nr:MAG: SMI1/KNR4 family protein [Flavobacterium sp.]